MRVKRILATATLALALGAAPASAQTLGDVGGTTGLIDTLAGGSLPTITAPEVCSTTTLPDLDEDGNVIQREMTCTQGGSTTTTAPPAAAEPPAQARANGYYCKPLRGRALSACVRAMAQLRKDSAQSPARACRTVSRRRVRGLRGTPYSRCVSGGTRLLRDLSPA